MSFLFQHPGLFGLLALAGAPLLVHLLARAKPPLYRFSNLEFLQKVLRLTSRFRKPKDRLLLALRTLALLALAAAFIGPLLQSRDAPLPGEKRTLVLVIDRSASMAAREGAVSRFEAACAEAGRILDATRPDFANVIWLDASPDAVFPEPAPNREFLSGEFTRATARPEAGALEAAFELAGRQFQHAEGRRELHIISDFQAAAWQDFAPPVPAGVTVQWVPVARADVANLAVSSLTPVPASPVAGQQMRVQCRVTNHSDESRRVALTLDAGGSRQSQALELTPRGEAEAAFHVRCPTAGLLPLTAGIDADGFPGDDRRHAVVRVRESLRLAIAAPAAAPTTHTLLQIARALPWLDALPAADPAHLPPCEFLELPAWDGDAPEALRERAAKGTAVIVHPSPVCPLAAIAALLAPGPATAPAEPAGLESSAEGWQVTPAADHPAFRLFAGGEFGNPLGGRFRKRIRLPELPAGHTFARFDDGRPALIEATDRPLLISNLSLDPAVATWSAEPAFLPAIAELMLHLMPRGAAENFETAPGEPLVWENPLADDPGEPALEAPDGTPEKLIRTGATWHAESPAIPGIHRWLVSGQAVHLTAVNFPASESALRPLATPPAPAGAREIRAATSRRAVLDGGLPLWPWLVVAGLACLVIEGFVAQRQSAACRPAHP